MIQIAVVKRGDTLFKMATQYGTTIEQIVLDNGLNASAPLVIGQALLVNTKGNVYYVQSGDSLYTIALTYNVPLQTLAKVNNLSLNKMLLENQRLYIPKGQKRIIEPIAYLQPTTVPIKESLLSATKAISPNLTYLAYFSFEAKRDGTLKEPVSLEAVLNITMQNRVIPMLVITNLENGNFSSEVTSLIFNNPSLQNTFITNVITTAQKYNMRDVHFDFENVAPKDREPYNQFLRNVKTRLPEGYTLSTTLVPKTRSDQKGAIYEGLDYKAHGTIVDFVVIMTYDWGWQGGPAQAVSPIGPVKEVIQYAKTQMPANKIVLGQNLYGFDWTLPYKAGGKAQAVSSVAAVAIARNNNVPIRYDYRAQAPTFNYVKDGKEHEVWFEDVRSLQAKFNLIKEQGLRGISYWKIGLPFPQNSRLLSENFTINKKG
ncbi:glycosyl hydrolase family 18 protein [Ectobacillus antri]|jgi:spore germination protein|uniref:Glycosyl hydrolase family 18 protein n=1 Tax=Ectobacillus antri TaxID=2486280 RepID=A0ABT6H791_9BACI|nr:glycosyl hydrolase family 18 protein [Ectobacillus antri]MDG4656852.1 glycosyl hydrolase family 18 protein [Ectobacillus antri]MDG5754251.1 glycosyl hydrolase family 18 protein [Ectobacillus antri]